MKSALLVLLALSSSGFAYGSALGLNDGRCVGTGVLHTESLWLPDFKFKALRVVEGEAVDATSSVSFLGFKTTIYANLFFRATSVKNQYDVLDRNEPNETSYAKVGKAICDTESCTFNAVVMGGDLELEETIVKTSEGFDIVEGFQTYKGQSGSYTASFICE